MKANSQIKGQDLNIVVLKKPFCMNVNKNVNLLIRDLLKISKFSESKDMLLVNS